ncbi:Glycerol-3-phosphate dehydrogenase, mitochondrial [Takifugu flavidus]|uniref:glycerol-3-phosphate dehydrogenase n=1 Tax=Takifugu flavidus TaxID=433684 RepID=A0A5C6PP64_9TELE|nr:Glycerol-3-phosphate dehydrogenase, mitochondrial [Takifugu flavidus]
MLRASVACRSFYTDLKSVPVHGDDFSSDASSRSSRLIHGGVRYLQKAIMKLDYKQRRDPLFPSHLTRRSSVKAEFGSAVKERPSALQNPSEGGKVGVGLAQTFTGPQHFVQPQTSSHSTEFCTSRKLVCAERRAAIALMQSDRDRCDISVPTHFHTTSHRLGVTHIPLLWSCPPAAGQHDDARMNLAITRTAARYGAAIANYTEAVHLVKGADPRMGKERVCGARSEDASAGQEFDVRAKCVINAMGPFTDTPQKMDDQKNPDICQRSAEVHIVITGYYRRRLLSLRTKQPGSGCEWCRRRPRPGAQVRRPEESPPLLLSQVKVQIYVS